MKINKILLKYILEVFIKTCNLQMNKYLNFLPDIVTKYQESDLYIRYLDISGIGTCIYENIIPELIGNDCAHVGRLNIMDYKVNVKHEFIPFPRNTIYEEENADRELTRSVYACKSRLIMVSVTTEYPIDKRHGHYSTLLFDKKEKIVEHFDSGLSMSTLESNEYIIVPPVVKKIVSTHFPGYTFLEPLRICPMRDISLQQSIKRVGGDINYCMLWGMLYGIHRILAPDEPVGKIINQYFSLPSKTLRTIIEAIGSFVVDKCQSYSGYDCYKPPTTIEVAKWLIDQKQLLTYEQTVNEASIEIDEKLILSFGSRRAEQINKFMVLIGKTASIFGANVENRVPLKPIILSTLQDVISFIGSDKLILNSDDRFKENWMVTHDIISNRESCVFIGYNIDDIMKYLYDKYSISKFKITPLILI